MSGQKQVVEFGSRIRGWIASDKIILTGVMVYVALYMIYTNISHGNGDDADTVNTRQNLQTLEIFGLIVAVYLLLKAGRRRFDIADVVTCAVPVALALLGFEGLPVTVLAVCVYCGSRGDAYRRAAATVIGALAVQAVWAPMIFNALSAYLLPLDAAVAGFALSWLMPGATWDHTVVTTPSGFSAIVGWGCSSFHNLSLATLCWVTVTMMQRPYWVRRDLWIGGIAMFVQLVSNVIRLIVVCSGDRMYQYWHEGTGRHVFAAGATFAAIVIVSLGAPWAARKAAGGGNASRRLAA